MYIYICCHLLRFLSNLAVDEHTPFFNMLQALSNHWVSFKDKD